MTPKTRSALACAVLFAISAPPLAACSSSGDGAITITSARYGANCGSGSDVSDSIADTCSGKASCTCGKECFSGNEDPHPSCAKGLTVSYTFNGAPKTVSCPAVGDEKYVFSIGADGEGKCSASGSSSSSSSSGSSSGCTGCTADSDCGRCGRCERSSCTCRTKAVCN